MKFLIAIAFWCALLLSLYIFPWEAVVRLDSGQPIGRGTINEGDTPKQPPEMDYHGSMQGVMGFVARPLTSEDRVVLSKSCGSYFGVTRNKKIGTALIYRAVTPDNMDGPGRIGGAELGDVDVLVIDEAKPMPPIILVALQSRRTTIRIGSIEFALAKECLPTPGTSGSSKYTT